MSLDMNVDYNECKLLINSFQKCFLDEKKRLMDEKNFDRPAARTNL